MEKPTESDYEVFLSFRGPDTRRDMADYLYNSLIRAGIRAYRDNEELPIGEEIGPELVHAIKQSEISIPILSKGYAASPWCLMELVQMVECKENWGCKIMPVFYDVAPSDVLRQTGSYGEAINLHINKQRYTDETIQNWKAALSKVGTLRGWELKERGKGEFTEEVVRTLLIELKKNYLTVSDYLVEMDDHVDKIMEVIGEQTTETKIIGIYGMGGVGKTTLATIIYNKLSANSTNCCFLSNFKDTKINILQNQLISGILKETFLPIHNISEGITEIKKRLFSRKVILLLDDVVQKTQLDALVGMGKCWYSRGSKVIITTRNKVVLKDVDLKHELTEMDFDHSLQLFSRHAFRRDHPPAEYFYLSNKAVKICGHLPLALEIIGSFLAGKDGKFWETTLEKLETIPDENVEEKLNISIEALQPHAKEIFLDVCCFFVGFDWRIVRHMWKSCGFFPDYYLDVLQQMSLIKITERDELWVHDLLRDLGQHFVRRSGNFNLEKQSRVWDHEQANDVLIAKGTENVEALRLKFDHQSQRFFKKEELENLSNLRFLQVDCGDLHMNNVQHFSLTNSFRRNLCILLKSRWLSWHNFVQHFPSTKFFQKNLLILPELRFLSWHKFSIFFRLTTFSLTKLVILDLSRSKITNDWEGWNQLKMAKNLKVLNLTECRNLRGTPDFSAHENLERLILQGCKGLVQVDKSIGKLKHLVFLNLEGCYNLRTLPNEMGELEALTELIVDGTSITKIPEWKGMKKLETLSAVECASLSICNFTGCLTSLSNLRLKNTQITELPFGNFGSLVELNISDSRIGELPNSIGKMKNLRVLRMSRTSLRKLPSALGMLEKLEEIDAAGCEYLEEIPSEIGRLSFLRILILILSSTGISEVPKVPESLTNLFLTARAPSLQWISRLRKLESLELFCSGSASQLPPDFNLLSKLRELVLKVDNLECLPRLPQNLSRLRIYGRRIMEKSIDLSYLEKLSELSIWNCEQLIEIQGLERLKNLKRLRLGELPSLVKLADLTSLKKLMVLWISYCPMLVELRGQLESLETLNIMCCESLKKWPDSFNVKAIDIQACWKLKEIQGMEDLKNLRCLSLVDLPSLEKLPDLTNSKKLEELVLRGCPCVIEIPGRLESLERLQLHRCGSLRKLSHPSSAKKLMILLVGGCKKFEETLESDKYRDLKKVRR
ncbi:disease resistance protein RPV1-like [Syzygium oleosum]|uniref:disease resistance protein RPV1-like n=1 Tax=Syzygium oleosum TaxID=219896 RepID=UPI0024BB4C32|nr:disease resistance protein RPV1-like [Syzygium oleosum]XP_056168031.1 disease resistance protein RPV1-like [Syzygium oleosum]XP_056168032.1 disease resistance protein RPV1-like [Syzygium oleosum]XP_056168033.1 disease resistance protein RPV1-like [Syzygium oleosum]XP_056168034.1 disease resistance protein RPV1-like [Syzygium oleosum]XP_056168035.1 disease resistance protein RPV1-like [Syzygium oleosum]